jgi:alkylhydroperoxidase/carboxymuconolactone decarboxylase family protein YurZ
VNPFARLPQPPAPEDVAPEELADLEHVVERTGRVHGAESPAAQYFGALLNSPPLAAALSRLGTEVRRGGLRGTYTDADRELMDIALAVALGSNAILPIHIPDALAVGVRPDAVDALLLRRDDQLTDDERHLVTYAREFVAGTVSDGAYAALRERFGGRGAVEFTVLVGFLLMTIRLWQAFGLPEPSDEEMRTLLHELREGTAPLPDAQARIG